MTGPLCATHPDPETWFREDPLSVAAAKAVCAVCPARVACELLGADEPYGTFGGRTAEERLGGLLLLVDACPAPVPHRASRGCYVQGCDRPECREANRVYVAAHRARPVTAADSIDSCEQLTIGVSA